MSALSAPILLIDSSLGGLALVRALRQRLPHERLLYFADLARAPYHQRSPEAVARYVRQAARLLGASQAKAVILACDVAAAVMGPLPQGWTSVLDPAARALVEAAGDADRPVLGVLASAAAIERRVLERAIMRRRTKARLLLRPAPTLATLAEEGRDDADPLMIIAGEQALEPLLSRGANAVLLASPALMPLRERLSALAGEEVRVVDAARATADDIARRLMRARLLRPGADQPQGSIDWCLTDESPALFDRAERIVGSELPPPRIVALEELEAWDDEAPLRSTG